MKLSITFFLLFIFIIPISAQQFAPIIDNDNIAFLRDFEIITAKGETLECKKLSSFSQAQGRLKSFSFKTADGVKYKFKAAQISEVNAKLTNVAKGAIIADKATKSIESAVTADYAGIVAENKIRFNSVVYNKKKGKQALLQLINYGFDQKIKVYPDPNSESGITSMDGVAVSGGKIKAFYLVKGSESFFVNKKSYKKLYDTLYGDCEEMKTDPKSVSIDNLCEDILNYNHYCN